MHRGPRPAAAAAAGSALPPGWEECRTESGEVYYQDHNRGVTTWERPAPVAQPPVPTPRTPYRGATSAAPAPPAAARSGSPPLPSGWAKAFTATGEPFYVDHNTHATTWEDPRKLRPVPSARPNPRVDVPQYARHGGSSYRDANPAPQRPIPRGPPRGPVAPDAWAERQLERERQAVAAEKARIQAQLRAEQDLRRQSSELERRRMEIEREKAELAQMKAQLARTLNSPLLAPAYPHAPAPAYAPPPPRRGSKGGKGGGNGPIRPLGPMQPVERVATVAPPTERVGPWVCAECNVENLVNKFRCQNCTANRPVPDTQGPPTHGAADPIATANGGAPVGPGSLIPCRYGTTCHRPDCAFGHPELQPANRKPCRYGEGCRDPVCTFAHVVLVPRTPAPAAAAFRGGKGKGKGPRGPRERPRSAEDLQIPEGLAPGVVAKVQELYTSGVDVSQKTLELLGQLDVAAAEDCLQATLSDPNAGGRAAVLKTLIDLQLSCAVVSTAPMAHAADGAPDPKRPRLE